MSAALPSLVVGAFASLDAQVARSVRGAGTTVFCVRSGWLLHRGRPVVSSPRVTRGLVAVLASGGRVLAYDDLCDAVWGDDPDGGPLNYEKSKDVLMLRMRHAAADIGLAIRTVRGFGLRCEVGAAPRAAADARVPAPGRARDLRAAA